MQQIATRICVTTVKRMTRNDDLWVFRIPLFCNTAFFSSDLVLGFSFRNLEVVRMCRWSDEKRREKEKEQERLVAYRKPETRCARERTGVKWPDAHVTTSYNQTRSSNMRNLETCFNIFRIILLLRLVSSHQNFLRACCWVSMFLFRNRRITVATDRSRTWIYPKLDFCSRRRLICIPILLRNHKIASCRMRFSCDISAFWLFGGRMYCTFDIRKKYTFHCSVSCECTCAMRVETSMIQCRIIV